MNKKVVVALGFSLIVFGALAQNKNYSQQFYNQLDGLMSQTVNSVEMVESGHLLVATTNGIFLFDGHRFFRPKYHERIESRRIDDILKINEREFLMLGGNPNCVYYIKKSQLVWKEPIEGARNIKQLVSFNAKTNTLYKRSGNKIFHKSPGQAQWQGPLASSDSLIISFVNDNEGALYFWNGEELVYQDQSIKKVLYAAPGRADLIWKYHVARDERVLCWTQDSIFEFRSGVRVREAFYEIPDEWVVRDVCEFQDGSFWYATQGSEILEYSDGVVTGHLDDFNLNGLQITSAFRDLNGTLWLGTIGKGLLKIEPSKSRLVQNSVDIKVNVLADDGEHLLVGTSKGIYSLGKSGLERLLSGRDFADNLEDVFLNNYTHQLRFSENHWVISTMRTRLQEHRNVFISEVLGKRALIRNCPSMDLHNGSLYLGFWGSFSVFAPPYTARRSNIRFNRENIKLGRTNLFVPIEEGVVTVCDYTVFLTSKQGADVDTFSVLGKDELGFNNTYLDLIVSDEKWFIATGNGVFKGKFNSEKRKLEEVEQISFSESQTICLIEEGPLWIGTSTGLLKYENEELSTVGLHKDLSQGKITTLFLNERNGILYVGTVSGLYEIDPKQKTVQDQMFNLCHYWIDHNGQVDTGASIVTLPYDGNAFSVNASFTSFLGTEEPVLRYSINGEEPVSANSTGFRVTALATGDHSLSLWGEANNGETTPKVEIGVTVLLPFWKSTQGILSFLAVGALLISLVVAIRLRTLKKQQATQRLLNELEKKALNLSLNPHFLFNSLNSMQSRLSQYKDEDLVNYVADFSDLMRKTLENSDKSGIPLENELAQLEKYLIMEQRRFKDKFSYIIDVPQEVQELELEIPPMLLQPFVENAIMHGILPSSEPGEILILSRLERGFLVFEIRDNGVGLKYKSGGHHVSKGIDITKKRVELLHEENMVEIKDRFDGLGSHGVTVTIKLKVDTTQWSTLKPLLRCQTTLAKGSTIQCELNADNPHQVNTFRADQSTFGKVVFSMGHFQHCIDRILSVQTVLASTSLWVPYFRTLCCFTLLVIGGELRGQSLVTDFEIMGTKEGLPHENVSCMGLDSFGFLWVGTTGGIARFDGQAFDLVELDESFSTHSQTRVVSALITDDDGIWVGTMGGLLAHYKLETQKWTYIDLPEKSKSKPYKISCLNLAGETMFIGCVDGQVLAVNTTDSTIYEYQMSGYPVIQVQSTIDSVWVSTVQQCFRAPTDNLNKVDTLPWGYVAMTRGAKLYKDQDKVKWTGRFNGNVVFKEVGRRQFFTTHILAAHDGFAAFSKDNIYAIDANGNIEEQFPITYNPALSLISTTNCALNTENGILWIGTDIGLIKVVKDRYHFKKYRMAGSPGSPPFSYVRTVHYFQNQLLGGSKFGGAFRLSFPAEQPVRFESINVYGAFGENYGTFNTFLNTKKGDVIAGAVDGLYTYHEDSVFRPLTAFDELLDGVKPQVWSLLEDRFGRIWVGTLGMGLLIYEPETSQLIRIEKGGSEGLSSNSVWALTKGGDGCIWVGTSNGLDSVSYTETAIKCTPLSQIVQERIDGQEVWHVVPDREDNLWIGTTDNGLSYFNRKERSIRNYHRADGLLNETVSGLVLQLDEKRLWISTQNGLFALNIERDEFHRLTVDDGLVSNEFNFKAITITETGEVFLGTKAGLMSFDPKVVLNDKTTYPLHISHLRVGNDIVNPHGILTLSPKLRQFSAKFSLLDYSAPEKHTFRYRLKPLEEDWTYTSNRERTATYTNLPPGEYELLVEGSVNEQWQTVGGTGLTVVVPSKLIEETWFRGLLLLLLLLAVTSIVRLRFVQLRDRARIQVKMAELERRMLTAQMSPHFLFNSMNAIQQFVLCNDSRSAQVYLSRFSSLIRMFLEASRNKLISLSDELRLLETYTELERIRFEDRFEVHFDIEQGLALDEIEIPTSLIQPFVENAILHGLAPKQEKGHLLVKMWEEQKVLWVWVDDDGVGRAVAEKNRNGLRHAPQGMKLVSELAKSYSLLDGFPESEIEVIDKTEKDGSTMGTRIVLKIDICQSK